MRVRVKVCGITDAAGLACALKAGVDAVGFNFHRASPRFITPDRTALLVRQVPPAVATVGIFADRSLREVAAWMDESGVGWAQFHGNEHPDMLTSFTRPWYPAVRPGRGETRMDADWQAPLILVDARHPGLLGGSGQQADWPAARRLARRRSVILAGGLGPGNLAAAVRAVAPWGVDLNSGVETAPGRKDETLLAQAMKVLEPWRPPGEEGWL